MKLPHVEMNVEYMPLTQEEKASPTHFCNRCETLQPRFQLHDCEATDRWKVAKGIPINPVEEAELEPAA